MIRPCVSTLGASLCILLSVLATPGPVVAQETSTLRVLVTSGEDGGPVVGANVLLRALDGERKRGGVTDRDGFLEFRGVPAGRHLLRVSFVGHETYRDTLRLEGGERQVERVSLRVRVQALDEVVVEDQRTVTTGAVGVRTISEVDVGRVPSPGPGGDLVSYLQTLPGVTMIGGRGGQFRVRGGTPSQNRILINNLPVVKPFHISNLFSAFPQEAVQSADVYAGGFGAEYMGATSAVVDVRLRPGNMKQYSGSVAASPYLTSFRVEGPLETDRQSFLVMGRTSLLRQSAPYLAGDEVPLSFSDVVGQYSIQDDAFYCNATGMYTTDRGRISTLRSARMSWSNTVIGTRCAGFDEWFARPFDVTIGYTNFQNAEMAGEETERSAGVSQLHAKIDLQDDLYELPVHYGFRTKLLRYSATLSERFTRLQSFEVPTEVFRIYGSAKWSPGDRLTVRPSVGTQLTLNSVPTLEPRLRVSYRPDGTATQELSLALGRYYQLMSGIRDERDIGTVFRVLKPNEGDRPFARALHGLLGYRQRIGAHAEVNVEGYIKDHRNIPVSKWTPEPRLAVETGQAHGLAYGFDVRAEYNRESFYVLLSCGWSKVRYEAARESLGAWTGGRVFNYAPGHDRRHKLNVVASYEFAGATASLRWEYGSGRPYTQIQGYDLSLQLPDESPTEVPGTAKIFYSRPYGSRLPPYHRLDLSVERSFELSSRLSLKAEVGAVNLYDRRNIFYIDVESLQRVNQTPLLPHVSLSTSLN